MKNLTSQVMVKDRMLSPYNQERDKNISRATFIHPWTASSIQGFRQEKEIQALSVGLKESKRISIYR